MKRHAIPAALALALSLAACAGGDEGGGTAGVGGGGTGGTGDAGGTGGTGGVEAPACSVEVAACGGDLVGTWSLVSNCGEMYQLIDAGTAAPCRHLSVTIAWDRWAATTTYDDDGTYYGTYDLERSFTLEVPAACLEALAPEDPDAACAAAGAYGPGRSLGDGGCARDEAGACTCVYRQAASGSERGNWTVDGDRLLQDSFVVPMPYCVAGDHLVRDAYDPGTGAALGWVYRRVEG
jgi:hypothetical protein